MFLMVDLVGVVFFELAVGVAGDVFQGEGVGALDEQSYGDDESLLYGGVDHAAIDGQAQRVVERDGHVAEILVELYVNGVVIHVGFDIVGTCAEVKPPLEIDLLGSAWRVGGLASGRRSNGAHAKQQECFDFHFRLF